MSPWYPNEYPHEIITWLLVQTHRPCLYHRTSPATFSPKKNAAFGRSWPPVKIQKTMEIHEFPPGKWSRNGRCSSGWWLVSTPLKNDGVRQLGWWHSQYDGKKNVPNHQPVIVFQVNILPSGIPCWVSVVFWVQKRFSEQTRIILGAAYQSPKSPGPCELAL